ncbi:MAG: NAD-dependent epimerase/dehydratase family protein [Pseudomonadota bacterium]|nr:NAD-dependent epimerase/dehydratase family protein [Pseudomonadota bacterium]
MPRRILVTGGTGFIGSRLFEILQSLNQYDIRLVVRELNPDISLSQFEVAGIDGITDYSEVIAGCDVVIHIAAIAHNSNSDLASFAENLNRVNVDGTLNLARQSANAGVKRFIFISTIGVNGSVSLEPFTEESKSSPHNPYSISKYRAELGLRELAESSQMELVIIRPPLVYGSNAAGSFRSLHNLLVKPIPLPFGLVNNQRSMIYIDNLVDFIIRCVEHPAAANQTFLVSDGEDISLRRLIAEMRLSMGSSPTLFPVPVALFRLLGKLTGKSGVVDSLVGDLQVDSSKARKRLGWTPPYTFSQGIAETVNDFKERNK